MNCKWDLGSADAAVLPMIEGSSNFSSTWGEVAIRSFILTHLSEKETHDETHLAIILEAHLNFELCQ